MPTNGHKRHLHSMLRRASLKSFPFKNQKREASATSADDVYAAVVAGFQTAPHAGPKFSDVPLSAFGFPPLNCTLHGHACSPARLKYF